MSTKPKRRNYKRFAIILVYVSFAISIGILVLFFRHRTFDSNAAIDTEIFGQFGDIIGGLTGTIIALVSILLLYETLNEQRRQFNKQIGETRTQLKEQKEQFQKQAEQQLFYSLVDRLQNHTHNTSLPHNSGTKQGNEAFKFLAKEVGEYIRNLLKRYGEDQIVQNPDLIDADNMVKILKNKYRNFDEQERDAYEGYRSMFKSEILELPIENRWQTIRIAVPGVARAAILENNAISVGSRFFQMRFGNDIKTDLNRIFNSTIQPHYYAIEGYINEAQFLCEQIEQFSSDQPFYIRYFNAQITSDQKKVMYYCLLCGKMTKKFSLFAENANLFDDMATIFADDHLFDSEFLIKNKTVISSLYS